MDIQINVRSDKAHRAFQVAPKVMERHLDGALWRGTEEITREARRRAPKAFSNLVNSIRSLRLGGLRYRVSSGTNYARAVEEGTKPGTFPNPVHLMGWIKLRGGIRFGATKAGTAARQSQYDALRDRAWGLAWSIHAKGTKAHAYMQPAAEVKTARVYELVEKAVDAANVEIFG